jgi:hypothetical protein
MNRLVFIYGAIAGLVIIATSIISLEFGRGQAWLAYLVMFIAFSTIFVAIKQYRDDSLGGVIRFGKAFLLGIGISVFAGVVYVAIWELYLFITDYEFIDSYADGIVNAGIDSETSEAELAQFRVDAAEFRDIYTNPFLRVPATFLEVFPPGFLVALCSAMILRNRR